MSKKSPLHQQDPGKIGSFSGILSRDFIVPSLETKEDPDWIPGKYFRLKKPLFLFSPSLRSNNSLAERGERLLDSTLSCWLRGALPALPEEGVQVGIVLVSHYDVRDTKLFVSDPYPRGSVVVRFGSASTWIRFFAIRPGYKLGCRSD